MDNNFFKVSWQRRGIGWLIHALTASGACFGLLALYAIYQQKPIAALWMMAIAIVIDAVDGMFARLIKIKLAVPEIDGALLDNIVDFFTYTMVPAFFLSVTMLLPAAWRFVCVMIIIFSSAYQFCQVEAKTSDHFFKGFPSYWNIVVFYLFFWKMNPWINLSILFILALLSFVPIKYVYPSRLDYLTTSGFLRFTLLLLTIIWGAATGGLLWIYPHASPILTSLSMGYLILYVVISLYRTCYPLAVK